MPKRIIMHIDMDYFFAAVEERERPSLKDKPVVVGADPKGGKGRGVVSTCNYSARKYGIRSGMPISIAYRKCPDAEYLPVNFELYEKVSEKLMRIFRKYSDKTEQVSIDEIFLDISDRIKNYSEAKKLALKIKKEVRAKEKLTCSIGIGPNKLIAKIASDMQKPDGLTIVRPEEVRKFLNPLSVRKLWGIGPKTEGILNSMGIYTVSDLRRLSKRHLVEIFGKYGEDLYLEAKGIDESPVEEYEEIKSIGRQHTFERDTKDEKLIFKTMKEMLDDIYKRLKEYGFSSYQTVTVKVRYEDFETHTKQETLKEKIKNKKPAEKLSKELLEPFLLDERKIRLVGISLSKLSE